jgi:hypothetical protein
MSIIGKGGAIFKALTAQRCVNCDTIIENVRGSWFHLNTLKTGCKDSNLVATPKDHNE